MATSFLATKIIKVGVIALETRHIRIKVISFHFQTIFFKKHFFFLLFEIILLNKVIISNFIIFSYCLFNSMSMLYTHTHSQL